MRRTKIWGLVAGACALLVAVWVFLVSPRVQMAPPSPPLRGFGGQQQWILTEDMVWQIDDTDLSITVPRGFVTDLASAPPLVWPLGMTPQGQYGRAAIVHDYLYWTQRCSRAQSDRLMWKAMQESGVDEAVSSRIHSTVSMAGGPAWAANARDRASGGFRVLPVGLDRPANSNLDWPQYRRSLAGTAITDPVMTVDPRVCVYADGITIPVPQGDGHTPRMPGG